MGHGDSSPDTECPTQGDRPDEAEAEKGDKAGSEAKVGLLYAEPFMKASVVGSPRGEYNPSKEE